MDIVTNVFFTASVTAKKHACHRQVPQHISEIVHVFPSATSFKKKSKKKGQRPYIKSLTIHECQRRRQAGKTKYPVSEEPQVPRGPTTSSSSRNRQVRSTKRQATPRRKRRLLHSHYTPLQPVALDYKRKVVRSATRTSTFSICSV